MKIRFTESAARDLEFWKETDPKIVARIRSLLDSIRATPFAGIGKPESLKHDLAGYWSRRINREHRLVSHRERRGHRDSVPVSLLIALSNLVPVSTHAPARWITGPGGARPYDSSSARMGKRRLWRRSAAEMGTR